MKNVKRVDVWCRGIHRYSVGLRCCLLCCAVTLVVTLVSGLVALAVCGSDGFYERSFASLGWNSYNPEALYDYADTVASIYGPARGVVLAMVGAMVFFLFAAIVCCLIIYSKLVPLREGRAVIVDGEGKGLTAREVGEWFPSYAVGRQVAFILEEADLGFLKFLRLSFVFLQFKFGGCCCERSKR